MHTHSISMTVKQQEFFEKLSQRASALFQYSFGFQPFRDPDKNALRVAFCTCGKIENVVMVYIKASSRSKTIKKEAIINDSGRDDSFYLSIDIKEIHLIDNILNLMLAKKKWFMTQNVLAARFDPEQGDTQYSSQIAEKKTISKLKYCLVNNPSSIFEFSQSFFCIWNYTSHEGKIFCTQLRALCQLPPASFDDPMCFYQWDLFKNCNYIDLTDHHE